jgi:4-amino-4-deoxy-L-arabinose transferase-like glycosyltransferase
MNRSTWRNSSIIAAICFLAFCVLLILLRPLLPVDETRYLTVAWEMWTDGSYIVPHLNGEPYSHKPPMLFWLINLVWAVFGPSEFCARLVGPLAGAATVFLTAQLAAAIWPDDQSRPTRSAWILATTGTFMAFGSATMFDALLALSTVLAMLAVWKVAATRSLVWGGVLGASFACGVLVKGPVIAIHVLPVIIAMPFWLPRAASSTGNSLWAPLCGAAISASALVSLWVVPAILMGGEDYRNAILWHQTAGRVASSFAHERPFWFYLALLPVLLWPWGWDLKALSFRKNPLPPPERFLLVWLGSAFLAFSLVSGKQIHYLVPEMPATALVFSALRPNRKGVLLLGLALAPAAVLILWSITVANGSLEPSFLNGARPANFDIALSLAILAVVACLIFLARTGFQATLAIAPATLLIVQLCAFRPLWLSNDTSRLGALLADFGKGGVATLDSSYAGQFTFTARLPEPVRVLDSRDELELWRQTAPDGVLLARGPEDLDNAVLLGNDSVQGEPWYLYQLHPQKATDARTATRP